MANDIIDINVYETVETVAITVNPNLTTVNINQITSSSGGANLTTSQTSSNFTINSDTGTDASVPLGNGTLAGATLNDYTTTEKNKLAAITGTNTGDDSTNTTSNAYADAKVSDTAYDATSWNGVTTIAPSKNAIRDKIQSTGLQEITNIGANTSIPINVFAIVASTAITGQSGPGTGVLGISGTGTGVEGASNTGIGVYGYSETGVAGEFNTDSATANIANFKNGGTVLASINNAGYLTAQKLKKDGGTSSEILAADGSVITAGNNITITGGQISSVGGAGGGGSSVNYYLNGGTNQGTFGGTTYYEFSKTAVIGTGADFNISSNGYIASFITDVADPSLLLIPAGNWNLEFFFSSSSAGGSPSFYAELYKYDGTTFTLIASGSAAPEGITNGTTIDAYFTALAVPETVLTVNDRLAIRVYVTASGKTITLHTQNGHLCEVITTFSAGLTALNGLQAQVQNFAVGTTGTDFAINSSGSTHTFNLPSASATARGVVTTSSQTFAGSKTFTGGIISNTISVSSTNFIAIFAFSQDSDAINGESANGIGVSGSSTNGVGGYFNTVNGANIAEFKTNSVLKAKINSGGIITGTGLNASGQTINTIASFDGSKNVVSLPTATYPSLTELALVKGVSGSSIQTQLDSKQATISLTTTGTSGAATLTGATLNIPQYSGATNLGYTAAPTNGTVTSSTGTSATLPLADATNAGLLKPAKFTVLENTSGTNTGDQNLSGYALLTSPTFTGTPSLPTGTIGVTQTAGDNTTKLATTAFVSTAVAAGGVTVSGQDTFGTANIATVTAAQYANFVTAGTVSATTLYFITA